MPERYLSVKKIQLPDGRIATLCDDEWFVPFDPPKPRRIRHEANSDDLGFVNRNPVLTTEDIEDKFFK